MKKQQPPWQWMYKRRLWDRRRKDQLTKQPLCEECLRYGDIKAACVAHHVKPHRGDWYQFCHGELESLCKRCHDQHTATVERAGVPTKPRIGLDGWPIYRSET